MGTDCCGGPAAACQEKTRDFGEASAKLENHDPSRSWEEIYASKKSYYDHRVATFESIKAKYDDALEAAKNAAQPITLTMPDGSTREGVKGVTTPMDIALGISKSLAKKSVVARVDGGVWDMMRPLEGSCKLELVTFDDPDGKDTFWHSSAHLLGQALELEFGADLTIGPALEEGFYYDCFLGNRWVFVVDATETCAGPRPCAPAPLRQRLYHAALAPRYKTQADTFPMFTPGPVQFKNLGCGCPKNGQVFSVNGLHRKRQDHIPI